MNTLFSYEKSYNSNYYIYSNKVAAPNKYIELIKTKE